MSEHKVPLPNLQVPLVEADLSLTDVRVLCKWAERVARSYGDAREQAGWNAAIEWAKRVIDDHGRRFASENGNSYDFDRCGRAVLEGKK